MVTCKVMALPVAGKMYQRLFCISSTGNISSELDNRSNEKRRGELMVAALCGFKNYVCFEFLVPQAGHAAIAELLQFELPRRIPLPMADLTVFFRCFMQDDRQCILRIFAVKTIEWHNALAKLKDEKLDVLLHPFMTVARNREESIYYPEFEPDYIWHFNGLLWEMIPYDGNTPPATDAEEQTAKYVCSPQFQQDKKYLCCLPPVMKINRYRFWKWALVVLILINLGAAAALMILHYSDRREQLSIARNALDEVDYRLAYMTGELERTRNLSEICTKVIVAAEYDLLPVLNELTTRLPESAWITGLRAGNQELNLVISATGNIEPVNTALNQLNNFIVDSLRQQSNPDGSGTIYAGLKYQEPQP